MSANPAFMKSFAAVSDAELARAREDPVFRQKLLKQNLEVLLASLQRYRSLATSNRGTAKQLREGVELAVRLAELIQARNTPKTRR